MLPELDKAGIKLEHTRYDTGKPIMLVNFRVAILTGWPQCEYIAPEPTVIHSVSEAGEGCWMTDMPCELVQMHYELARHARGEVLVGGLGLGIVARMCAERRQVRRVAVVECSDAIIRHVWPLVRERLPAHVASKIDVYKDDIHAHAKLKHIKYDVALLDTWQATGEMVWTGEVVPLRRALYGKARSVYAWQEEAMHTQMTRALFRVSTLKSDEAVRGIPHYYAFWHALEQEGIVRRQVDGKPSDLGFLMQGEEAMRENAENIGVRSIASILIHLVGCGEWERLFGKHWDRAVEHSRQASTGLREQADANL